MRHCACGVLINDGCILLGKRSPERKLYPNAWNMIGGHQEAGKTLDETLVREFEEEIAVTPTESREVTVLAKPRLAETDVSGYQGQPFSALAAPGPHRGGCARHGECRIDAGADARLGRRRQAV